MCLVVVLCGVGQNANATILTADVAVNSPGGQWAPLEVGEFVYGHWNRYSWYDIPTFAEEGRFQFWQSNSGGMGNVLAGITTFEVLTDGPVLLACTTRWGGGGNSSGDWLHEVTTRAELESEGWAEFATGLNFAQVGATEPGIDYIIFRRDSFAGEVFTYRTEKYVLPAIIRSANPVPEPSSLIVWFLIALSFGGFGWRKRNN